MVFVDPESTIQAQAKPMTLDLHSIGILYGGLFWKIYIHGHPKFSNPLPWQTLTYMFLSISLVGPGIRRFILRIWG